MLICTGSVLPFEIKEVIYKLVKYDKDSAAICCIWVIDVICMLNLFFIQIKDYFVIKFIEAKKHYRCE